MKNIINWFIVTLFSILFIGFAFNEKEIIPSIVYLSWICLFIPKFQEYTFDRIKKFKLIIKIVSFLFILIAWVSVSDIETKQVETQKEEINENINKEELKTEEKVEEEIVKNNYKIIESDDISIPTAERYNIKVVIDQSTSEEIIKEISEEIIKIYEEKWSNATAIFYYMHEAEVDWWYTLAKAEWSPNWNWAEAHLKKNYEVVYDFKKYVWEEDIKTPTEEERQITKQIRDLYYEMNDSPGTFVTEKEVYNILSPKLNKSVEELEKIHTKVTFFEMWY